MGGQVRGVAEDFADAGIPLRPLRSSHSGLDTFNVEGDMGDEVVDVVQQHLLVLDVVHAQQPHQDVAAAEQLRLVIGQLGPGRNGNLGCVGEPEHRAFPFPTFSPPPREFT